MNVNDIKRRASTTSLARCEADIDRWWHNVSNLARRYEGPVRSQRKIAALVEERTFHKAYLAKLG